MVYYLLYYAVERFKFEAKDFDELLKQSRERNACLAITGKLIYCEGVFIQVLEGTESDVEKVYASIKRDYRLEGTKLVTTGSVENRYFKNWSMDFEQISLDAINELEQCSHPNVTEYIANAPAVKLLKLFNRK